MLACGLLVRDTKEAFRADDGRLLLLRIAVSELGEQLWRDSKDFATISISGHRPRSRSPEESPWPGPLP